MSPQREWKTEGEIKAIVHAEMRDVLQKQNELLEKIADGAQAQVLSANLLHGNAEIGLKGFIPEALDRLAALEAGAVAARELDAARDGRLDKMEANQGRILKYGSDFCKAFFIKDGSIDWKRVSGIFVGFGSLAHAMFWPHQTASMLRAVWTMVTKAQR